MAWGLSSSTVEGCYRALRKCRYKGEACMCAGMRAYWGLNGCVELRV